MASWSSTPRPRSSAPTTSSSCPATSVSAPPSTPRPPHPRFPQPNRRRNDAIWLWKSGLVEQVGVGGADVLPERLEAEPAGEREGGLLARVGGVLVVDLLRVAGGHRQQLGLARALQGDEPERRLVDRLAHREQAVVLVDRRLAAGEVGGELLARVGIEDDGAALRGDHRV